MIHKHAIPILEFDDNPQAVIMPNHEGLDLQLPKKCIYAFKAFKDKRGSKFRELSLISILTLIAFVLISITNLQNNQSNDNQFRSSLHFIEIVSKELGVDKKNVYVNTSAVTDGAIIKVGDNFYRAISGTDQDSYLLEKMELYKSDVELVEVEK